MGRNGMGRALICIPPVEKSGVQTPPAAGLLSRSLPGFGWSPLAHTPGYEWLPNTPHVAFRVVVWSAYNGDEFTRLFGMSRPVLPITRTNRKDKIIAGNPKNKTPFTGGRLEIPQCRQRENGKPPVNEAFVPVLF
jgi:hypothetical protein